MVHQPGDALQHTGRRPPDPRPRPADLRNVSGWFARGKGNLAVGGSAWTGGDRRRHRISELSGNWRICEAVWA